MLNIAVFAPMQMANVSSAVIVKVRSLSSNLTAKRRSFVIRHSSFVIRHSSLRCPYVPYRTRPARPRFLSERPERQDAQVGGLRRQTRRAVFLPERRHARLH